MVSGPEAPPAFGVDTHDDSTNELRTLVTVSRRHPRDCGERQVFVRLDADIKATLRFGQTFTREIEPGSHRLRAHNTLFRKTVDFAVEPGEHLEFIVINRGHPVLYGLAGLFGAAPLFLEVRRRSVL